MAPGLAADTAAATVLRALAQSVGWKRCIDSASPNSAVLPADPGRVTSGALSRCGLATEPYANLPLSHSQP